MSSEFAPGGGKWALEALKDGKRVLRSEGAALGGPTSKEAEVHSVGTKDGGLPFPEPWRPKGEPPAHMKESGT